MRRRGSLSIEAAMVLPLVTIVFGAVAQVMLTSQARVHVEHAAYAAARSALVHKCPPFNVTDLLKSPIAGASTFTCKDDPQKWEDAARWALVAAGSPSGFANGRGCPTIPAGEELLAGSGQLAGYDTAAKAAMCYAFEPANVRVEVAWDQSLFSNLTGTQAVPITATVTFRYPLSTPIRRFLDGTKRGDGTYYREETATVTLL